MRKPGTFISATSPLMWLLVLIVSYSAYSTFTGKPVSSVVQSDGRGYYAYLPALFIYNDPSFSQTIAAEKKYHPEEYDAYCLFPKGDGAVYNKYFPGTAVMQAPFFSLAAVISLVFQLPVDGYSPVFMICWYLGSIFYAVLGILLAFQLFRRLLPDTNGKKIECIIALLVLTGPLVYYGFFTQSYSQHYSLALFAASGTAFLNYAETAKRKYIFQLAFFVGLIFLIRPTNLVFLLLLPALLHDQQQFKEVFSRLFSSLGSWLLPSVLLFTATASILLFFWKWQTGSWILWSYTGEGFNFIHPQWWSSLFSFRIGLFLQIPVFLLLIPCLVIVFRKKYYFLSWWGIYFIANIWIIAAWWCWDFESQFSIRPLTEHFLFMALPLVIWLQQSRSRALIVVGVFAVINLVRVGELRSGFMGDQRFTAANYLPSLAFWKAENHGRWRFTQSCHPFGEIKDGKVLIDHPEVETIAPDKEFALTGKSMLPKAESGRLYYTVTLEKKIFARKLEGTFLVIDATGKSGRKRYYTASDLFNDAFEGRKEWKSLTFEGLIPDNFEELEEVTIYIWNPGKNNLLLRNVKASVQAYGAG